MWLIKKLQQVKLFIRLNNKEFLTLSGKAQHDSIIKSPANSKTKPFLDIVLLTFNHYIQATVTFLNKQGAKEIQLIRLYFVMFVFLRDAFERQMLITGTL